MIAAPLRRPSVSTLVAAAVAVIALAMPVVALADTGPGTFGDDPGAAGVDTGPLGLLLAIAAAAIIVVGLVALLRRYAPRALRPIAALLAVAGTVMAVLFVLALGVLSSWTDEGSNVPLPFLVAAVVVGIGGGIVTAWIVRGRRPAEPAPEPAPSPDPAPAPDPVPPA